MSDPAAWALFVLALLWIGLLVFLSTLWIEHRWGKGR